MGKDAGAATDDSSRESSDGSSDGNAGGSGSSAELRARGTAACVRASSGRAIRDRWSCSNEGGTSLSTDLASRGRSDASADSRVDASMSSPCRTMLLPIAAASSRPVANRSSREGESTFITMCSSSGGTSST